jgi:CRISPR-associated protein Cas1
MWFSKKRSTENSGEPASVDSTKGTATTASHKTARMSTADTAHLIGPGCVKLVGKIPTWQPVTGSRLQLHPQYLRRVFCYGNVDFSTAVLRLFWQRGTQVSFLSPSGNSLLGKLQPSGDAPNLPRLQHLAAANAAFTLSMAQEIVLAKIESQRGAARYFQQQGKGNSAGKVIMSLKQVETKVELASSLDQLRGIEGIATANWFRFLTTVFPPTWEFKKRIARPATDPVNALLSLGYTLAHHRCETLLAAADLDPRVGFLHDIRAGRASLACDLMEPLRAALIDRLVVATLARKTLTLDSFVQQGSAWRLQPEDFKRFLSVFEQAFHDATQNPSMQQRTLDRIDQIRERIRAFGGLGNGGNS